MISSGIAISAILHTNPGRFAMQSCQDCYNCLETTEPLWATTIVSYNSRDIITGGMGPSVV